MKKFIYSGAIVLGLGMLAVPSTASAHSTSLTPSTPCRASATADWIVSWTVSPDLTVDLTWAITSPSPSGYTPSGSQPSNLPFSKTVSYPGSQTSASESIRATWSDGQARDRTARIDRPPVCEGTTTTVPEVTTTVPEVTTTVPEVTTTVPEVTTTVPEVTTTTEPVEGPEETTTVPEETTTVPEETTTTEPVEGPVESTTTAPTSTDVSNTGPEDTTDSSGTPPSTGPSSPENGGPTLPATGRDSIKDMLTAALLLFGFGGLMVSAARGRRSELLDY